jgi:hypothetical protein
MQNTDWSVIFTHVWPFYNPRLGVNIAIVIVLLDDRPLLYFLMS